MKAVHPVENTKANNISIAEVLTDLKALNRIDNLLGKMATSISTMENNLVHIKWEVTANKRCIEEAETCITTAEEKLERTKSALALATKRTAHLEAKTNDLENCGRMDLDGRWRVQFWTLCMTCYQSG